MRFDVLTIFPEFFEGFKNHSMIARAIENKKIQIEVFDIRAFSTDKHRKVDDIPYGGGVGMVMACQPLFDCISYVKKLKRDHAPVIYMSAKGEVFQQGMAENFAMEFAKKRIILLCGHYEGIDERVIESLVDTEISIGPFVLTGGELAAQVFIDAVARLIPGVLGKEASFEEESFSEKLERGLEYPHYTRPEEFRGMKVPEVLLSGHHAKIEQWRMEKVKNKNIKRSKP